MFLNSGVHASKMTNMFLVVCFFCPLLFFSGQAQYPPAAALYKFTAADRCNTTLPGTLRFRKEVGTRFMVKTMIEAADFVFRVFQQGNVNLRKHPVNTKVHMEVHDNLDKAAGYYFLNRATNTQTIFVSASDMKDIPANNLIKRVQEIVYHEMTHVWQWYGNESTPTPPAMLFEGIADYTPLVAGLKNYGKPGDGDKWNQGYEVTAFFLAYCNSLKPGFVAMLNSKMRFNYNDTYFKDLLGKSVKDLWRDYKNRYAFKSSTGGSSRKMLSAMIGKVRAS